MTNRRVKLTLTGYYEINMDRAEEDYGTTDPTKMLAIDQENIRNYPEEIIDSLDGEFEVELTWEN